MTTLRLTHVAVPVLLLACGLLGGPMVIYDVRVDPAQADANVVYLDPHTVTVHSRTVVNMTIYVWIRDWNGDGGADEGLMKANFGAESGTGGLLGDITWTCAPLYAHSWAYSKGATFDHDGDGDKDIGGIYCRPYTDLSYAESNWADFPIAQYSLMGWKMWDPSDGDLGEAVLGPDSNIYVGFKIGTMRFTVTSASVRDLNTALHIYPFFFAPYSYFPHKFTSDGDNYNLNQPVDGNYTPDSNLRRASYVTDLGSFLVQAADPVNIIGAPEPAAISLLVLAGAAALWRRPRTRRGPARTRDRGTTTQGPQRLSHP